MCMSQLKNISWRLSISTMNMNVLQPNASLSYYNSGKLNHKFTKYLLSLKSSMGWKTRVKFTHWLWRCAVITGLTSVRRTLYTWNSLNIRITFSTTGQQTSDIRQQTPFIGLWLRHSQKLLRNICILLHFFHTKIPGLNSFSMDLFDFS